MKRARMLLILAALLPGCGASMPPNNVGFARLSTIRDLQGSYENRGELAEGVNSGPRYLSAVIWPEANGTGLGRPDIPHARIETIVVEVVGDTALLVRALAGDEVVKEETYVQGRDFQFQSGRLVLRRGYRSDVGRDSPVLGGTHTSVELGLDEQGQGKYKMTETSAGLAYLVIPFIGGQTWEARFVRKAK